MSSFVYNPGTRFLDPQQTLFETGLVKGQIVSDLGAGSGFYALGAAQIVGQKGQVFVTDILDSALSNVVSEARIRNLRNIKTIRTDLEQPESCKAIPSGTSDVVVLANVLHQITNRTNLLAEVYRLLKTSGKLLLVEWNDQPAPIGPVSSDRLKESAVLDMVQAASLKFVRKLETDRFHYGLIFSK
ncbi:MAG TPA: class I SAM-dependent methyltransferase [Patescibacteria group bacterium]|jgi:ubiquinone/menaquinone biosynthesis C-methylase UbiE|nr:class I SAM-dependent methyltransferase [Patescibacteria group bacterium]